MTAEEFNCAFCQKEQPNNVNSPGMPCQDESCRHRALSWALNVLDELSKKLRTSSHVNYIASDVPLKPLGEELEFLYPLRESRKFEPLQKEKFQKPPLYKRNQYLSPLLRRKFGDELRPLYEENIQELIDPASIPKFVLADQTGQRCADCGTSLTGEGKKVKRCAYCLDLRRRGYYKCTMESCLVWHPSGHNCPLRAWGSRL